MLVHKGDDVIQLATSKATIRELEDRERSVQLSNANIVVSDAKTILHAISQYTKFTGSGFSRNIRERIEGRREQTLPM